MSRVASRSRKITNKSKIRKCNICGFEGSKLTIRSHKALAHPSAALPTAKIVQGNEAVRPSLADQLRQVSPPPGKTSAAPQPQKSPANSVIIPSPPRGETIIRRESIASGFIKPATKPIIGRPALPNAPAQLPPKLTVWAAPSSLYFICPLCQGRVLKTRLNKHLKKAHSRVPRAQLAKAQTKLARPNPKSPRQAASKNSASHPEEQGIRATVKFVSDLPSWQRHDEMDANRGMGHFARDNGRFGSHALHDRFDDESAP